MASQTASAAIPSPSQAVSQLSAQNGMWKWNVISQAMCLGIPGLTLILRLYVRIWIKRTWILEDSLAALSYISLAIYGAFLTIIVNHHGGAHERGIRQSVAHDIFYWINVVQIWYGPAAAFIKSTILLLYLRVFSPNRWTFLDTSIRLFIVVIVLFCSSVSLVKVFECQPRAKIWDPTMNGTCINLSTLLDATGVFNILSDVVILLVPVKGLWKLKIARKKKIAIYATFTVGIIGPAFSIVGLIARFQHASSPDLTYYQPIIALWAMAELATGMMVICLPTLPSLLRKRRQSGSLSGTARSEHYVLSDRYYRIGRSSISRQGEDEGTINRAPLSEIRNEQRSVSHYTPPIVNSIQGGYRTAQTPLVSDARPGEIVKTVTVEQVHS